MVMRTRNSQSAQWRPTLRSNLPPRPLASPSPPPTATSSPMQTLRLHKKYPEVTQDEIFDLINSFKCVSIWILWIILIESFRSAIHTDTPGRINKNSVLQALQNSGESYDQARETLKHVSVDASGKVELEDWVEVRPDSNDVISYTPSSSTLCPSSTSSYEPRTRLRCYLQGLGEWWSRGQMLTLAIRSMKMNGWNLRITSME